MLCIVSHYEIYRKVKFKPCLYCPDQYLAHSQNCVPYLPLCFICVLSDCILAAFKCVLCDLSLQGPDSYQ